MSAGSRSSVKTRCPSYGGARKKRRSCAICASLAMLRNSCVGRRRSMRSSVTRRVRLPVQHGQPEAIRLSINRPSAAARPASTSVEGAGPSSIRAMRASGTKVATRAAIAASRRAALAPHASVSKIIADGAAPKCRLLTKGQPPLRTSLLGSTPSCFSLRYRCVRSRPVRSATRVMLPPSRTRWCSK